MPESLPPRGRHPPTQGAPGRGERPPRLPEARLPEEGARAEHKTRTSRNRNPQASRMRPFQGRRASSFRAALSRRCSHCPLCLFELMAAMAPGHHLFPSRTEKLSPAAPMVLRKRESRQPPAFFTVSPERNAPGTPFLFSAPCRLRAPRLLALPFARFAVFA